MAWSHSGLGTSTRTWAGALGAIAKSFWLAGHLPHTHPLGSFHPCIKWQAGRLASSTCPVAGGTSDFPNTPRSIPAVPRWQLAGATGSADAARLGQGWYEYLVPFPAWEQVAKTSVAQWGICQCTLSTSGSAWLDSQPGTSRTKATRQSLITPACFVLYLVPRTDFQKSRPPSSKSIASCTISTPMWPGPHTSAS